MNVGFAYAIGAYLTWALLPLYWKQITHIPALYILCHRIIWSALFFWILVFLKNRLPILISLTRKKENIFRLLLSSFLISTNWFLYIYSVISNHLIEASLGYFMIPIVHTALGFFVLKERPKPLQWVSIFTAAFGVLFMAFKTEGAVWLSLLLALSFGFYGLLRKTQDATPLSASTIETSFASLFVLIYLFFQKDISFLEFSFFDETWLILGGVLTALPLLWFIEAAQRLPLTLLGFFQYIPPLGQFIIAVCIYDEPFSKNHWISFIVIWIALILFSTTLKSKKPKMLFS